MSGALVPGSHVRGIRLTLQVSFSFSLVLYRILYPLQSTGNQDWYGVCFIAFFFTANSQNQFMILLVFMKRLLGC